MATKQAFIGSACEAFVMMRLCQLSLVPFRPMIDGSASDLIAEADGHTHRLQVKALVRKGTTRVRLERSGASGMRAGQNRVYTKRDVDFVVVVDLDVPECFVIPATGRRNIGVKELDQYREAWEQLT
jgi:hypothetical protein